MLITRFHPVLRVEMRQLYLRCALDFKDVVPNKTQRKIYPHYIHQKVFLRKDTQVHFYINCITFRNKLRPLGWRCGSAAARSAVWVCGRSLYGTRGPHPAAGKMSVFCDCCVLSGSGLCKGLITHPEESYRAWYM